MLKKFYFDLPSALDIILITSNATNTSLLKNYYLLLNFL